MKTPLAVPSFIFIDFSGVRFFLACLFVMVCLQPRLARGEDELPGERQSVDLLEGTDVQLPIPNDGEPQEPASLGLNNPDVELEPPDEPVPETPQLLPDEERADDSNEKIPAEGDEFPPVQPDVDEIDLFETRVNDLSLDHVGQTSGVDVASSPLPAEPAPALDESKALGMNQVESDPVKSDELTNEPSFPVVVVWPLSVLLALGAGYLLGMQRSPNRVRKVAVPYLFSDNETRIAIIGDIHGNLEALQAVLADIKKQGINQIVCTGDIVGYGADPGACVDIIRKRRIPTVRGNHDSYCVHDASSRQFKEDAAKTIAWTRAHMRPRQLEFLRSLPETLALGRFQLVHASLDEPGCWHYVLRQEMAEASMELQAQPVCFIGHTHVPMAFEAEGRVVKCIAPEVVALRSGRKYLVNVGSVGQPRDMNTKAAYGIFDTIAETVNIKRVSYDVSATQSKIRKAGLPDKNAARLADGK